MSVRSMLGDSWTNAIGENKLFELLSEVGEFLQEERQREDIVVRPPAGDERTFMAFRLTPIEKVRVVLLGVDIYHDSSFNGVCFGNDESKKSLSPSLKNIIKEIKRSYGDGDVDQTLYSWAKQGVLLINTAHTVRAGEPGSHLPIWNKFTTEIFKVISTRNDIVWLLLGAQAQKYEQHIINSTHKIVKAGHPSPLNRVNPLVGSDCFVQVNEYLKTDTILWNSPF